MKKLLTALSIICLIPGAIGIVMSLFINLYECEKIFMLICGVLAMVFIIIADPEILSRKTKNYDGWLDDDCEYYYEYDDDDDGYYYDYDEDDDEGYYDYDDNDDDEYEDDEYYDDWEE